MKTTSPQRVRIIVDATFGERLEALPAGEPVWVVATPANEAVALRLWQERSAIGHLTDITTFRPGSTGQPEQDFVAILGSVDLHHGEYSAHSPYPVLEVVGCRPTEEVHAALSEVGFSVIAPTDEGFVARRPDRDA